MASIVRLEIRGVRSFDPNSTQTVDFAKPLTVILGKNGAGKTTIIESLLNASAGVMPPGSGTEKSSFVYDPKVMGEGEVKGQLRLMISTKGGELVQVTRSFQVTRSRNKTQFAMLDNAIARQDKVTKQVVSGSYRTADVDHVIPELLAVSRAVLEHVVFCHQENGNWPLLPPKDVKVIFDDIFAATRYVLALERIRDNRKALVAKKKEHEQALLLVREQREQAKQLEGDVSTKEQQVAMMRARNENIEPELKELQSVDAALAGIEQNIQALEREASIIQGRMQHIEDAITAIRLPRGEETLEQLQELQATLDRDAAAAESEVRDKGERRAGVERTLREREDELMRARSQVQILEAEDRQQRANCTALLERLAHFPGCGAEHLTVAADNVDERGLASAAAAAKAQVEGAERAAQERRRRRAAELQGDEDKRQALLRSMDTDAKEAEMVDAQRRAAAAKLKELAAALSSSGGPEKAAADLSRTTAEVAQLEQRVQALKDLRGWGEHQQRRDAVIGRISSLNQRLSELREEMANRQLASSGAVELTTMRAMLSELEADTRAALADLLPELSAKMIVEADSQTAASAAPPSAAAVHAKVVQCRRRRGEALAAASEAVQTLRSKIDVASQRIDQKTEELAALREEEQRYVEACAAVLGTEATVDAYEDALKAARESASAVQQQRHAREAMAACYGQFVEAARATNQCMVCERSFADNKACEHFIQQQLLRQRQSLEEQQQQQKQHHDEGPAGVAAAEARLAALEGLAVPVARLRRLRATLGPLETSLARLREELADHRAALHLAETRRGDVEGQVAEVDAAIQRFANILAKESEAAAQRAKLDRRAREIEAADKAMRAKRGEKTANSDDAPERSYEELAAESDECNAELQRLNQQLSEIQRMDDGADYHDLDKELGEKREERYRLQTALAKLEDLVSRREGLQKEVAAAQARLEAIQANKTQQQKQLAALEAHLAEVRGRHDAEEARERAADKEKTAHYHAMQGAMAQVTAYIEAGKAARLREARGSIPALEAAVQRLQAELASLSSEAAAAQRAIDERYRRRAELARLVERAQLERSLAEDARRLQDVEARQREVKGSRVANVEKLLGADGAADRSLSAIREAIRVKLGELERRRATEEGSMRAVQQDVEALRAQLKQEKYRKAELRYRSEFLKVITTETAIKDCDKFYTALEAAVQSYHQEKIEQINTIIAELWQTTYRGNDIDTIKIHSETESTSAANARRSYSYRVVMCRGNTEIDMRGRCSAGQKVLASVVIRLALSQAFCCDCGILALDEPTTNLDEENALSLAKSLRTLIELRGRNVRHFQLIVITHDEQFVRELGGNTLDTFYYVHKDREGAFSVIDKKTFGQLFE